MPWRNAVPRMQAASSTPCTLACKRRHARRAAWLASAARTLPVECELNERRDRIDAEFLHDPCPVRFDGLDADAQYVRDRLVHLARDHEAHDFTFARSE